MAMQTQLLNRFRERADEAGSTVHIIPDSAGLRGTVELVAPDGRVALAPRFAASRPRIVASLGPRAVVITGENPVATAAGCPVGMMAGELAVAETGSVLVVEDELSDRVVSMLCQTLIQVVPGSKLVATLDDTAAWLSARGGGAGRAGYAALITGPSRTADIERSLTIGVQGASRVHVVIVEAE